MLKKIALVMLLALPMGVFAQNLKFGHINAQEIITVMPEFTKAQNDIQTLEKQLTAELQRTQEEFNKKYQEFQQLWPRTLFLLTSLKEDKKSCRT